MLSSPSLSLRSPTLFGSAADNVISLLPLQLATIQEQFWPVGSSWDLLRISEEGLLSRSELSLSLVLTSCSILRVGEQVAEGGPLGVSTTGM